MPLLPLRNNLGNEIMEQSLPSKTYKLDFENNRIVDTVDGIQAISQGVTKILSTERYRHLIYDWDYGHELNSLIGKDIEYIKAEQQRIIKEALTVDDRILDVSNYTFNDSYLGKLRISFTVLSTEGDIEMEVYASV